MIWISPCSRRFSGKSDGSEPAGSGKLKKFDELDIIVGTNRPDRRCHGHQGVDKTSYVGIFKPKDQWKRDISKEDRINEMPHRWNRSPGSVSASASQSSADDELVAGPVPN